VIGLAIGSVQLVEHNPQWAILAGAVCEEARRAGAELFLDVQHVGSTAVPGLRAKPILDIAAAAASSDCIPGIIHRLTDVGYVYRGDLGEDGGHLFVKSPSPDRRDIHLHVVLHDQAQWCNYLAFRDKLRADAALRTQYAALKAQLALTFAEDRRSYTAAKHTFIRQALKGL